MTPARHLTGTHKATIGKNRTLRLPTHFTAWLDERLMLFVSPDQQLKRLLIAERDVYREKTNRYLEAAPDVIARDTMQLVIFGCTKEVMIGASGTIPIPAELADLVGLGRDVLLIGCNDHIAILPAGSTFPMLTDNPNPTRRLKEQDD